MSGIRIRVKTEKQKLKELRKQEKTDKKNIRAEERLARRKEDFAPEVPQYIWEINAYLKYWLFFMAVFSFWEIITAFTMKTFSISSLFFLFFMPSVAALFASLSGIGNKISARIIFPVLTTLVSVYFITQIIYIRIFGTPYSIALAGMGNDAIENFGWAISDIVIAALFILFLVILPVIASVVMSIKNIPRVAVYRWWIHLAGVTLAVALWFGGILGIRAFGNDRMSPYYLFTNSTVSTESAVKKLGLITTSLVECGTYYLGIDSDKDTGFAYEEENYQPQEPVKEDIKVEVAGYTAEDLSEEDLEQFLSVPWTNEKLDFEQVASQTENSDVKEIAEYLDARGASETNKYTGMFEGYNLIYICAESFWSYACNSEVTPTLYKMSHNGIVLNNYYNSFYNTTTNGEFAFCTSLWPDVSRHSSSGTDIGSFAQSSTKYMPQGLGDLFTAQDIPSYAFHNYYGKYYRRILSWPNLGYKCRFTGDGMWFTSNWPASDLELMQQTVDDYINDDQFHVYYMTFSGHGPYSAKNHMFNKNIKAVTDITGEDSMNEMARGYLAGELELDSAMEYLLDRLEEAGKLDNTVIVLTGDHYPYYLDEEGRTSLTGQTIDEEFGIYNSNCIIYNSGMTEPILVDDYCCNVDIAPTMLNLLNIPFDSRMMMGRDIFSEQAHKRATLANKSFISDYVKYNYETGETKWTLKGNELSDAEKDKYLNSQLNSIDNEYKASCKMVEGNFFLKAYELAGLLTPEEISREKAREKSAQEQDDTFNLEDEEEKAQREAEKLLEEQMQLLQNGTVLEQQTPAVDGQQVVTDPANALQPAAPDLAVPANPADAAVPAVTQ